MILSVVTTLYNSAPYIEEFYRRVLAQIQVLPVNYEIVFVDDGSPDNALDVAIQISNRDPNVSVVELSKNFGHRKAMMTGLSQAHGGRYGRFGTPFSPKRFLWKSRPKRVVGWITK
jgi:putative glycosyltransferase